MLCIFPLAHLFRVYRLREISGHLCKTYHALDAQFSKMVMT